MTMRKPFETFEHEGRQFRLYYDELYQTRGSYAYDTEEETKAAENEEIAKLDSGERVVFGVRVFEPCPCKGSCPNCDGWNETVRMLGYRRAENNEAAIKAAALEL